MVVSQMLSSKAPLYRRIRIPKDRNRRIVLTVAILGLLLLPLVTYQIKSSLSRSDTRVCSSEVLRQAGSALSAKTHQKLGPIVKEIQETPRYLEDPNCLYIVTAYHVSNQDVENARQSYAAFEKVYTKETKISPVLLNGEYRSPQQLEDKIKFMSRLENEAADNAQGGADL